MTEISSLISVQFSLGIHDDSMPRVIALRV